MNNFEAYRYLCRVLSPTQAALPKAQPRSTRDWQTIGRLSSAHLVAPALPAALKRQGLWDQVPADFRDYLNTVLDMNSERNTAALRQLKEIGRALNVAGIEPMLLKGTAFLATGFYVDIGDRPMADLDLVVPPDQWLAAASVLAKLGGKPYDQQRPLPFPDSVPEYFEMCFINERWQLTVDLHHRCMSALRTAVAVEAIARTAPPRRIQKDFNFTVMSPTTYLAHTVIGQQWQDRNIIRGTCSARGLRDVARHLQVHREKIDFQVILKNLSEAGFALEWDSFSYAIRHLMGVVIPSGQTSKTLLNFHYFRLGLHLLWPWVYRASWLGSKAMRVVRAERIWSRLV